MCLSIESFPQPPPWHQNPMRLRVVESHFSQSRREMGYLGKGGRRRCLWYLICYRAASRATHLRRHSRLPPFAEYSETLRLRSGQALGHPAVMNVVGNSRFLTGLSARFGITMTRIWVVAIFVVTIVFLSACRCRDDLDRRDERGASSSTATAPACSLWRIRENPCGFR
jgi:hypothetical protein